MQEQLGVVNYIVGGDGEPPLETPVHQTQLGDEPLLCEVKRKSSGKGAEHLGVKYAIRTSGLPSEYESVAYAFREMWFNMPVLGEGAARRIKAQLHPLVWNTLTMIVVQEVGMQDVENTLGIPARSAKMLFKIGLDQIDGMPGLGHTYLGNQETSPNVGDMI